MSFLFEFSSTRSERKETVYILQGQSYCYYVVFEHELNLLNNPLIDILIDILID